MAEAMLPAELAEVTNPLQPGDELLTAEELADLSLFAALKKTPSFARFPGTTVLRKCKAGRVLVRQGESGATAFSILSTEDVIQLRELQLLKLREVLEAKEERRDPRGLHQHFELVSVKDLRVLEEQISDELVELRKQRKQYHDDDTPPVERHVSTAYLLLNDGVKQKVGFFKRMMLGVSSQKDRPEFISIDGPSDINSKTRQAPLHESELFGEMSCLNRAPRSATVVATRDCYMIEMLRNVLDMLHNDPEYQKKMDEVYRERVLDGQVRRLPLFQDLPDAEFAAIRERIQLVNYEAGTVVFEERDEADSFYVVRSGLVKVVRNSWTLLRAVEFKPDNWKNVWKELKEAAEDPVGALVWAKMPASVQEAAQGTPGEADQAALLAAFDSLIRTGDLHLELGRTTTEVVASIDSPQVATDCRDFPLGPKKWAEFDIRSFHRSLLEWVIPLGMPRRAATSGSRRILRYMGRGDFFGELGVITDSPRSATVFAYDHPDGGANQRLPDSRTGAVPSRCELIKMSKEDFLGLVEKSKKLKSRLNKIVAQYKEQAASAMTEEAEQINVRSQSPEFEQLGLIQGQKLMLIDLDRCTRCNQCVDACVASHDDGRTRLYLDGPRFEKFLVPLSCRSCLDPVCMIGCPVGSINRGDSGEIQIRDWCIGCAMCADQCPYGSIQMSALPGELELSASQQAILGDSDVKAVNDIAVVCDLCGTLPSAQPSCVYACPHDAAKRVNALEFFFKT